MAITATVTPGFTYETGVDITSTNLNQLGKPTVTINELSGTIVTLKSYAAEGVPSASPAGQMIYVTDGNAGAATVAVSDGSNWKVVALGATIG
jgi:hypothetical protein